jgi:twinkle protein
MKTSNQTITFERDDSDWLLELGRRQGVSRILPASSMHHLVEQFRPPHSDGLSLPWEGVRDSVRFMPGKVTIWSGPSFAGKTAMLRQLMLHAINGNRRALFISLEEEPEEVWREFTMMAAMTRSPNKHQVAWSEDHFENKLWVFDSTETLDPTTLMGIVRFGVEKFGFSHIVIDSLMRLNLRTDDYDGQREMGNMLGRLAKTSRAHIHLVAHPRKTANSREPMDMYDIRGAQDIIAQADLVLTLERKHKDAHTNLLTVWKQRGDTNWIGELPLWYCAKSRQLKIRAHDEPTRYLPADAYGPAEVVDLFPRDLP